MVVCLLLAAGSSSRMGQPKMLLPYQGKTLLQHIIDEVHQLKDAHLLVVTGCYHSLLQEILSAQNIAFVANQNWETGMGGSIQTGITFMQENYPHATGVAILVCDQPFISAGLLQQMINTKTNSAKGIIACSYGGTIGTPVLFDKKYFSALSLLNGPQGAKKIIRQFEGDLTTHPFPKGVIDIDTPSDYQQFAPNEPLL